MSVEEYSLKGIIKELLSYKSAIVGFAILAFLVGISIYSLTMTPYSKAGQLWNDQEIWLKYPRNAAPEWVNYFSSKKLPPNIVLGEGKPGHKKEVKKEGSYIKITYYDMFKYDYDDFPSDIIIFANASYSSRRPTMKVYWIKPNNDEIYLGRYRLKEGSNKIYVTNNIKLEAELSDQIIEKLGVKPNYSITIPRALFMAYTKDKLEVMKGEYTVRIEITLRNESDRVDYETIVYGKVYGIAGTDNMRRPLDLGLVWGAPIALAFGITASLAITFIQLILASISGYYGGKVDSIIQRLTEIYMILPFLPIVIMISLLYGIDIWRLLLVVIVLSIFGTSVKTYRVWVMQIKSYPYVEAAKAYGASNLRIVFLYILPRLLPPVVPSLVLAIPGYVFLEAALAFLGLSDINVVSWGRIVEEAFSGGALYKGYYHWVLMPSIMLVITAISFALIGLALDRIVNPKLREM